MKQLLIIILLLAASNAFAKPHTLGWNWPGVDCEGTAIAASDLRGAVIAYDVNPMPMPSDTDGECAIADDPDAPAAATVVPVPVTQSKITLNLMPGMTYYARFRVSVFIASNWSNWSVEKEFTVPYGKPNGIIWLN